MIFWKLSRARLNLSSIRLCSTTHRSSKLIRSQFLDFFIKDNNHQFVKSSSVIPYNDPTLSFVNAGMNQFKNILLSNQPAKHKRVANTQKCIRVGGKHNDLAVVGTDSYHHTFFEMLGNWSFGDYFKKDACEMAWKLLTEVYGIPAERLYVTFFNGDKKMGLEPDTECQEIWRKIGVPEDRIIGFGAKENFWEMGTTGPAGGCSEIHVDHLPSFRSVNRSCDVNRDKSDLTELWNIVFIEHFRQVNGSIERLPEKHIDTGMGFERLVAFLQNKSSNYDSDLFTPIFDNIHRVAGSPAYAGSFEGANCERDTAYRILADHSRMIAVSLADGIFPERNQKLRRVLRKCINISEKDFNKDNLLLETIPVVAATIGDTFPELNERLTTVLDIVKYEEEIFKSLRELMTKDVKAIIKQNPKLAELDMFDYPGFVPGYEEFSIYKKSNSFITGDFMYRLHSTFGFDVDLIERLAELEGMTMDKAGFDDKMTEVKKAFANQHLTPSLLTQLDDLLKESTDNDFKYEYIFDSERKIYHVEPMRSKILTIVDDKGSISSTQETSDSTVKLVLQQSPFYYESGGQEADAGYIYKNGKEFQLKSLFSRRNCVIHEIELNPTEPLRIGDEIELHVDEERRSALTRNHSATHLLNSAIRKITQSPIYQKSSLVTPDCLKIDLACFGPKISHQNLEDVEQLIRTHINERPLERKVHVINSQDLQNEENVIMIPGEIYPDDGIRLVTFGNFSKELCCGTHVLNTSELLEFTFISMRATGRSTYAFSAITGADAVKAVSIGNQLIDELKSLRQEAVLENFNQVSTRLREISIKLNNSNINVSFLKKLECQTITAEIKEKLKLESRNVLGELLDIEMKSALAKNPQSSFLIHFLECSDFMKSVSLKKATRHVKDRPVMVVSYTKGNAKAQCCVPKNHISDNFNAEIWMNEFAKVFNGQVGPSKGQEPKEVCNLKEKYVKSSQFYENLKTAISAASQFAERKI